MTWYIDLRLDKLLILQNENCKTVRDVKPSPNKKKKMRTSINPPSLGENPDQKSTSSNTEHGPGRQREEAAAPPSRAQAESEMWRATAPPRKKKKKTSPPPPLEEEVERMVQVLVPPLFDYPPIAARARSTAQRS